MFASDNISEFCNQLFWMVLNAEKPKSDLYKLFFIGTKNSLLDAVKPEHLKANDSKNKKCEHNFGV